MLPSDKVSDLTKTKPVDELFVLKLTGRVLGPLMFAEFLEKYTTDEQDGAKGSGISDEQGVLCDLDDLESNRNEESKCDNTKVDKCEIIETKNISESPKFLSKLGNLLKKKNKKL